MIPSTELLFALGILVFYLYDCIELRDANAFRFCYRSGRWFTEHSTSTLRIAGQFIAWQNPLQAHVISFRSEWRALKHHQKPLLPNRAQLQVFDRLAIVQMVLTVLMLLLMPICLLLYGVRNEFLAVLVAVLALIIWQLIRVYKNRKLLNLSKVQFFSLAAECILCVPFSLNLLRKIANLAPDFGSAHLVAKKLLDAREYAHWANTVVTQINEQQHWFDEDSADYLQLNEYKILILKGVKP